MQLMKYDIARKALAEANTIDDVKIIANQAEALQKYAKQIHDNEMENWLAEIKLRAKRNIGELTKEMPTKQGERTDKQTSPNDGGSKAQQLENAGISTQEASRCEKIASIPEENFETAINAAKDKNKPITYADVEKSVIGTGKDHNSQGNNDWYTPERYIESARKVLKGITTDPASSQTAQKTVKAKTFYTEETNGLNKDWTGNVWLNPPYSHPEVENFTSKLVDHFIDKSIKSAIVLVNNATDTKWFHEMLDQCTSVCLTKGRINFIDKSGTQQMSTRQGQVFLYFGDTPVTFENEFSQYGKVLTV